MKEKNLLPLVNFQEWNDFRCLFEFYSCFTLLLSDLTSPTLLGLSSGKKKKQTNCAPLSP